MGATLFLVKLNHMEMGGKDIYVIKTDLYGEQEWSKTYGGGSDDSGQSIIKASDGGYIIRYIVESFGAGNSSVGILKISQDGDEIWSKTIGGSYGITGNSLQYIDNGNYIMICSLFDYGNNSFNSYLLQFNDTGNILWDVVWGYRGRPRPRCFTNLRWRLYNNWQYK